MPPRWTPTHTDEPHRTGHGRLTGMSGWDVSAVHNMGSIFNDATDFNGAQQPDPVSSGDRSRKAAPAPQKAGGKKPKMSPHAVGAGLPAPGVEEEKKKKKKKSSTDRKRKAPRIVSKTKKKASFPSRYLKQKYAKLSATPEGVAQIKSVLAIAPDDRKFKICLPVGPSAISTTLFTTVVAAGLGWTADQVSAFRKANRASAEYKRAVRHVANPVTGITPQENYRAAGRAALDVPDIVTGITPRQNKRAALDVPAIVTGITPRQKYRAALDVPDIVTGITPRQKYRAAQDVPDIVTGITPRQRHHATRKAAGEVWFGETRTGPLELTTAELSTAYLDALAGPSPRTPHGIGGELFDNALAVGFMPKSVDPNSALGSFIALWHNTGVKAVGAVDMEGTGRMTTTGGDTTNDHKVWEHHAVALRLATVFAELRNAVGAADDDPGEDPDDELEADIEADLGDDDLLDMFEDDVEDDDRLDTFEDDIGDDIGDEREAEPILPSINVLSEGARAPPVGSKGPPTARTPHKEFAAASVDAVASVVEAIKKVNGTGTPVAIVTMGTDCNAHVQSVDDALVVQMDRVIRQLVSLQSKKAGMYVPAGGAFWKMMLSDGVGTYDHRAEGDARDSVRLFATVAENAACKYEKTVGEDGRYHLTAESRNVAGEAAGEDGRPKAGTYFDRVQGAMLAAERARFDAERAAANEEARARGGVRASGWSRLGNNAAGRLGGAEAAKLAKVTKVPELEGKKVVMNGQFAQVSRTFVLAALHKMGARPQRAIDGGTSIVLIGAGVRKSSAKWKRCQRLKDEYSEFKDGKWLAEMLCTAQLDKKKSAGKTPV